MEISTKSVEISTHPSGNFQSVVDLLGWCCRMTLLMSRSLDGCLGDRNLVQVELLNSYRVSTSLTLFEKSKLDDQHFGNVVEQFMNTPLTTQNPQWRVLCLFWEYLMSAPPRRCWVGNAASFCLCCRPTHSPSRSPIRTTSSIRCGVGTVGY